jgi:hypothetical protein
MLRKWRPTLGLHFPSVIGFSLSQPPSFGLPLSPPLFWPPSLPPPASFLCPLSSSLFRPPSLLASLLLSPSPCLPLSGHPPSPSRPPSSGLSPSPALLRPPTTYFSVHAGLPRPLSWPLSLPASSFGLPPLASLFRPPFLPFPQSPSFSCHSNPTVGPFYRLRSPPHSSPPLSDFHGLYLFLWPHPRPHSFALSLYPSPTLSLPSSFA